MDQGCAAQWVFIFNFYLLKSSCWTHSSVFLLRGRPSLNDELPVSSIVTMISPLHQVSLSGLLSLNEILCLPRVADLWITASTANQWDSYLVCLYLYVTFVRNFIVHIVENDLWLHHIVLKTIQDNAEDKLQRHSISKQHDLRHKCNKNKRWYDKKREGLHFNKFKAS